MELVAYGPAVAIGKSTVTTILTTETTLLTLSASTNIDSNDGKIDWKSQLTLYYSVLLGSATKVAFRYYFTPDSGATWFPLPVKNVGTGELADLPSLIDSGTYTDGTNRIAMDQIPMPACTGIRVTGQATGATATLNALVAMGRDN